MQIEEYRTRLKELHAAVNRQIYLYCSGQGRGLDLAGVTDYSDLSNLDTVLEIKSAMEQAADSFPSKRNVQFLTDKLREDLNP